MPKANPAAFEFLQTRRSRPAKTLTLPIPDRSVVETLLTLAARSPDHGKLEPWRFIVLARDALLRLGAAVPETGAALGKDAEQIAKMKAQFDTAHLVIAVVATPRPTEKVPEIEQVLSAGAVCLALVNAGLAAGWGANWLTGWASHDRDFVERHLGLNPDEFVAGFIHLGTETQTPPERPRPNVPAITAWIDA